MRNKQINLYLMAMACGVLWSNQALAQGAVAAGPTSVESVSVDPALHANQEYEDLLAGYDAQLKALNDEFNDKKAAIKDNPNLTEAQKEKDLADLDTSYYRDRRAAEEKFTKKRGEFERFHKNKVHDRQAGVDRHLEQKDMDQLDHELRAKHRDQELKDMDQADHKARVDRRLGEEKDHHRKMVDKRHDADFKRNHDGRVRPMPEGGRGHRR